MPQLATRTANSSQELQVVFFTAKEDLLQRRIQILIGNGKATSIGNDPWLPTTPSRAPNLLPTTDPELKVEALIYPILHQWNEDKLQSLIQPEDHHLIRKIFLPLKDEPDSHLWSPTKDGNYSVKSGYWTATNMAINDETPQPPLAHSPDIAASIWKLSITPKLKHFLWRVASKAIGTAENLRRRNINVNPYCSHCCNVLETCDHTFFTCPYAVSVWRAAGLPINQLCDPDTTIEDKLRQLFKINNDGHINRSTRFLPFWIMWRLWKGRNNLVFNRKAITTMETVNQAATDTKEWLDNAQKSDLTTRTAQVTKARREGWSKPPPGIMKCNYDVSHHDGNRASGLGWIIRDSTGAVLDCGMGKFQGRITTEEAECTSLIWALQAAWGLGYRMVEFEGDNQNINRAINEMRPTPRLHHYLETIWAWRQHFTLVSFKFKPREQNTCADILAKKAITCNNDWALYRSCPFFLFAAVNNDIGSGN
ncbi:Reverse transcriptase zinc-binding domain [Arabidopsis thaliana x Arabidopsis arenosa]|uniref:Reverse transcriptase zinc-binding domain n=1 Tax=Arabidopsis thaliana x Arabidopsis arenosa TaxID=1240361 RepID=A0A8T2A5U9_9BRAS|nr:Reverse transcriptase zinc-binding domain [Arabidopsis thaliana x Arabidopsis arenosa]